MRRGNRVGNLLGPTVYDVALILGITVLASPAELEIPAEVIAADLLVLAVVAVITVPVLLQVIGSAASRAAPSSPPMSATWSG